MPDANEPGPGQGPRPQAPAAPPATTAAPSSAAATRRRFRILGAIVILGLLGGGGYWYATRHLENTDNAVIDGDIVQIGPRIGGAVLTLNVGDNQAVKRGDLLLTLDPRDYEIALASARANLAGFEAQVAKAQVNVGYNRTTSTATLDQAQAGVDTARAVISQAQASAAAAAAEAERSRADLARYERLATTDFASRQRYEQAQADSRSSAARLTAAQQAIRAGEAQLNQAQGRLEEARTVPEQAAIRTAELQLAQAQVEAARAAVAMAETNLSYTRVTAPADGVVTRRKVNAGDQVERGQNLLALVIGAPWVTANFKETQITRMRPGQPVDIQIDAYSGRTLKGKVDSIQRGTGARFALLPPENATGNYVKVVQRVPVKIVFADLPPADLVLALGLSVVPTVDVSAGP